MKFADPNFSLYVIALRLYNWFAMHKEILECSQLKVLESSIYSMLIYRRFAMVATTN